MNIRSQKSNVVLISGFTMFSLLVGLQISHPVHADVGVRPILPGGSNIQPEAETPIQMGYELITMDIRPATEADNDIIQLNPEAYGLQFQPVAEASLTGNGPLFVPFLYGSYAGADASACLVGMRAGHGRGDLLRAVYEGVVFAHRSHCDRLLKVRGNPERIRVSGGAARSDVSVQMVADFFQLPVEVPEGSELGRTRGGYLRQCGDRVPQGLPRRVRERHGAFLTAFPASSGTGRSLCRKLLPLSTVFEHHGERLERDHPPWRRMSIGHHGVPKMKPSYLRVLGFVCAIGCASNV